MTTKRRKTSGCVVGVVVDLFHICVQGLIVSSSVHRCKLFRVTIIHINYLFHIRIFEVVFHSSITLNKQCNLVWPRHSKVSKRGPGHQGGQPASQDEPLLELQERHVSAAIHEILRHPSLLQGDRKAESLHDQAFFFKCFLKHLVLLPAEQKRNCDAFESHGTDG